MNRIKNFKTLFILLFAISFFACNDDKEDKLDNRKGDPYTFKIEVITQYPDSCDVGIGIVSYNYVDETGLPRTEWLTPAEEPVQWVPSPLIREYQIPRNFSKFFVDAGNMFKDDNLDAMFNDTHENSDITLKVYVNSKLVFSKTQRFGIGWQVLYTDKKKYAYQDGDGNIVEVSSLD